jgi:hypothetical protein
VSVTALMENGSTFRRAIPRNGTIASQFMKGCQVGTNQRDPLENGPTCPSRHAITSNEFQD